MQTLFEISGELLEFEQLMTDLDGEVPEGEIGTKLDEWFSQLLDARDEKLDNYGALIKLFEGRAKIRKEEAARMTQLATVDENAAKRLKARLKLFFEEQGYQEPINTRRFRIALQNNGGLNPIILDADAEAHPETLPEGFRRVVFSPDLTAIGDALSGEDEELKATVSKFAKFGDRGKHIRIR